MTAARGRLSSRLGRHRFKSGVINFLLPAPPRSDPRESDSLDRDEYHWFTAMPDSDRG